MKTTKILWEGECILTIHYNFHEYYVIHTAPTLEEGHYYAFVRRDDGRYGVLETIQKEVVKVVASDYDDIYYYCLFLDGIMVDRYLSVEDEYQKEEGTEDNRLSHDMGYFDDDYPLCLVQKGVEGLLTCRAMSFSPYASSGNGWSLGRSFVCESFSNEYLYIKEAVIRFDIIGGNCGKAWYGEKHEEVHYDDGGYNNWSCYKYQLGPGHCTGKWLVRDDNNPSVFVDDIVADEILVADFWDYRGAMIAYRYKDLCYLDFYAKTPSIEFKQRITCNSWRVYHTKKETLFFLTTEDGIMIYSGWKDYLSRRAYSFSFPKGINLKNVQVSLAYLTGDNKIEYDILSVDEEGNVTIQ